MPYKTVDRTGIQQVGGARSTALSVVLLGKNAAYRAVCIALDKEESPVSYLFGMYYSLAVARLSVLSHKESSRGILRIVGDDRSAA